MISQLVPFFKPDIGQEECDAASGALLSGVLTQGPHVQMFEQDFAAYQGVKHGVAVNSCTSALFLALKALGVGPGDEVITTPMSWVATALAITLTGARPVFADIFEHDGLMDADSIRPLINRHTKAIVPVHLYGVACDIDAINHAAGHIPVVWDCAHAIETRYDDHPSGSFGAAACYSFFGSKNITTAGEGGMVVTNDPVLANYVRRARLFGLELPAKSCVQFGAKFNMTEVQGAVGRVQLSQRLDRNWSRRKALSLLYDRLLGLWRVPDDDGVRDAYHLYTVRPLYRVKTMAGLREAGIGYGVHYESIQTHPEFGGAPIRLKAVQFGLGTLSLPLFPTMTDEQVEQVATVYKALQ